MDNNISKKTFLHKFFKLRFNNQKASLSVEELLQQKLISAFYLFQQNYNFAYDPQFIAKTINSKIALLHPSIESISFDWNKHRILLSLQSKPIIIYTSSVALFLASRIRKTPGIVAEELVDLLILQKDNINSRLDLNLYIEIEKSGVIYFCLDSKSIAIWLEKSLALLNTNIKPNLHSYLLKSADSNSISLFPIQYIHARCCDLLNLGKREKLFIEDNNAEYMFWLDRQNDLWLKEEAEFILLRQLFLINDLYTARSVDWQKLALNLSQIAAIFLAECRFLGEIKQENPLQAIARLKLIALTQYWLERLLIEKLNLTAPTSL